MPASDLALPEFDLAPARSRSRSIWLWQLSLAAGVGTITTIGAVLVPQMFLRATFAVGLLSFFAITVAALSVPWRLVPPQWVVAVPLADIVAIGLMAFNGEYRLPYLWVFPIAWVATYFSLRWLLIALGTATVILTIDAATQAAQPLTVQRIVVIILSLSFLGLATFNGARHSRALRRLLRRQAARLQRTLDGATAQARRGRQMFDSIDVGIARVDAEGRVLGANEAFIELYALDPGDLDLPGGTVEYDAERGDPLPAWRRPRARAAAGEILGDERVWLFDPDARWRVVAVSTRPLPDVPDGPSTALIVQDVTEIHRAEADRRAVLDVVAHELRNPLQAVLGNTEMLLDRDDLAPRARTQITTIDAAGERMLKLVTDHLPEVHAGGPPVVERGPVDVQRLVAASVEAFVPSARTAGVDLYYGEDTPLVCEGDAFRLRQVFDNLLNNAIKYTPDEGSVTVSTAIDDTALTVTVADTGIGIEPEDLPHIFEPYYRGRSARESGIRGSGIGMGIVHDIVTAHGGTVVARSEPGQGTTVVVTLPRLDDPPPRSALDAATPPRQAEEN